MTESEVRKQDIERLDDDLSDHEERLRSIKDEVTSLKNNWSVTKILAGIFGVTGIAVLGFLVYVNDKASTARKEISDEVTSGKSDLSAYIEEKKLELLPTGTIVPFGGPFYVDDRSENFPPGWLPCDGRACSSSGEEEKYARLFATIGTSWGDGTKGKFADSPKTDFNVPDLRGQFIRGVAEGTKFDPDSGKRTDIAGKVIGGVVGSYQLDQTGPHTHPLQQTEHGHNFDIFDGDKNQKGAADGDGRVDGNVGVSRTKIKITVLNNVGAETRPKNAYVNYLIKL